jgi:hypothetical protein
MTAARFAHSRRLLTFLLLIFMPALPTLVFGQTGATEEPLLGEVIGGATNTAAAPTGAATAEPPLPDNVLAAEIEWATIATLRSSFAFSVPLETVTEATLVIQQPGWSESPLGISIDPREFADASTTGEDFVYLWDVDPENAPNLFFSTTITWTFTFDDDTTAEVIDRVYYADPRTDWTAVYLRPETLLAVVPAERYSGPYVQTQLSPVIDLLEANTSQTPQLNTVVFDPRIPLDPCQTNDEGALIATAPESDQPVPCDPEAISAIYEASGFTLVELPSADVTTLVKTVASQLFNSVYDSLWADSDVPLWFQAGLERYYWPTPKIDLLVISQQAVRTGGLIRDIDSAPSDANRDAWLAQSYGLVLYISDQIGVDGGFELADRVTAGEDFAATYTELVGSDLSGLIPAWSNWVLTRGAEGAYGFYPYLPPTPTATTTSSRTPTFTPTATTTLTPSLTPSVTGELSPTPSATLPASDTPTPSATATFTVTPRSMESLFTPTPIPPDPQVESTANFLSAFSLGLMGLGVVLLISVLAYGFFQRNRGQ